MEERQAASPLVGREEILERLKQRLEALKKGYRQNVSLVGPRFIGKTFLLRQFLAEVSRDPEIIPLYILFKETDLDGFIERWLGSLLQGHLASRGISFPEDFQQLVRTSREYIPKTLDRMREVKKHGFQKKTALAFRELLSLTSTLREETGKKILLVLDEFQWLDSLELTDPLGLFGKEMMVQKDTFFLVTSSAPHRTKEIFSDRLSLLFGNFEVIEMGPLHLDEIKSWSQRRFAEFRIPEADLRLLSHLLNNHPGYFDLFFEGIERKMDRMGSGDPPGRPCNWSRELMLEILAESLFHETGLLYIHFKLEIKELARLGKQMRPCLKALMAVANGRAKLLQIIAYIGRPSAETKKILQRLVTEGVLEKKGSFFVLPDPLFRFWLRQVFYVKERELSSDPERAFFYFKNRLQDEMRKIEEEDQKDLTSRIEALFREFRNDVIEVSQKKIKCPAFLELASRPTNGRYFPVMGRTSNGRWFCQVFRDIVTEGDVAGFSDELKRSRKNIQRKVMVALGGIELNAKLMAQEGKILIWDLENLNSMLDLYGKLKVIQ